MYELCQVPLLGQRHCVTQSMMTFVNLHRQSPQNASWWYMAPLSALRH